MTKKNKKLNTTPSVRSPGTGSGVWNFIKHIEDMDKRGETIRSISGKSKGPFGSKAVYDYSVKLGIEAEDFPIKKEFHPRLRPKVHVRSLKGRVAGHLRSGLQDGMVGIFSESK